MSMNTATARRLGFDPARLERLRGWMQRYVEVGHLPGALALIARRGEIAYCDWLGRRDVEGGAPWERDTLVRAYSMTKPVASVALLQLYEDGLLHLDDPVDAFLPAFRARMVLRPDATSIEDVAPAQTRLTLHHLLTHTSGLTYGFNEGVLPSAYNEAGIEFRPRRAGTLAEMTDKLAAMPLQFEPGSRWNYGVSTDVVGRIVEVVSGRPLDTVLRERIFAPLGMADTDFSVPAGKLDRFANLYTAQADGSMKLVETGADSAYRAGEVTLHSGGGGLISTADDYLRFADTLRRGGRSAGGARILGSRTVALMASNHLPGDLASMGQAVFSEVSFTGVGFGLGVWVVLDPARAQTLSSAGDFGWGGLASTVFWVDPREDMVVVFLTQLTPSSRYPLRKELRALVYSSLE